MTNETLIHSNFVKRDEPFEAKLRPETLDAFLGQKSVCDRLEVMICAAKQRKEVLGHCLFSGPPGLGKTTLAMILAKAMGSQLVTTSGPLVEKPGDLAGLLTNLQRGDVLFIDEIHRMNRAVEEYLYSAMEDFVLDLMIDSGPAARSVQLKLSPFTLVGATTRVGLLTAPLRSRFLCACRLEYYKSDVLVSIVRRTADLLGMQIDVQSAEEVAGRCRGTPRIANNLLRFVRDFAQIKAEGKADKCVVKDALTLLGIDPLGLDVLDRKFLNVLVEHYEGGPVGLNTLATALGESAHTLEEVHEPFLVQKGLIKRTPRGREITLLGHKHWEKSRKEKAETV